MHNDGKSSFNKDLVNGKETVDTKKTSVTPSVNNKRHSEKVSAVAPAESN